MTPEEFKLVKGLAAQPDFQDALMRGAMTNHIARHHGRRTARRTPAGTLVTEKFGDMALTWDATHLIARAPHGRTEVRLVIVTREHEQPPTVTYGPPLTYTTRRAALAHLSDES